MRIEYATSDGKWNDRKAVAGSLGSQHLGESVRRLCHDAKGKGQARADEREDLNCMEATVCQGSVPHDEHQEEEGREKRCS